MPMPDFTPGSIFAHDYKIVSFLAAGGMGSVYLVEQLSTSKERALKVMHPSMSGDPKHRARFASEARLAGRIDSDHVVEVVSAGVEEASGTPWLVMELLRGSTLEDLLDQHGPLPIWQAREMARQLRHVLKRAHQQSIVHRDLKPENIFIAQPRRTDVSFTVKVLDFGIAKWVQEAQSEAKNSQIIGSPLWMAPEQLEPGTLIGPPTDVWALGLVFFYVFTGKSYWVAANAESSSVTAVLLELAVHPMPPPSERARKLGCREGCIPPGFDEWFARAAARSADARFESGEEALASLVAVLGAVSVPGVEHNTPILHTIAAPRSEIKSVSRDLASALEAIRGTGQDDAEMALRLAKVFELSDSENERAIEAYQRVLSLRSDSGEALHGLAALYRKHERWPELVETLVAVAELPSTDRDEAVRCYAEVATLRDDELDDPHGAEEALARAIELAPESPDAHERYAHLLAVGGRVGEAIAHLRAIASGETVEPPGRYRLLMLAVELAEPTLAAEAADALEAAVALAPESVEARARLAAMRAVQDDPDRALEGWTRVLRTDLQHERAWAEVFGLHRERGALDAAWCIADAAIGVLGEDKAPSALRDFHAEHYATVTSARPERLDEESFWKLAHPDLDRAISRAFAARLPALTQARASEPAALGVSVVELVDPATSSRKLLRAAMPIYRVMLPAGACLDVPSMPSLYFREGEGAGLRHLRTRPPASIAGDQTQSTWGEAELGFSCGEHLAYYRPELYARVLLPTPAERLEAWAGSGREPADLERWARGADLTASRAGLLFGRDLDAARRVLTEVAGLPGAPSAADRLRELAFFAISPAYLELRQRLRVAI